MVLVFHGKGEGKKDSCQGHAGMTEGKVSCQGHAGMTEGKDSCQGHAGMTEGKDSCSLPKACRGRPQHAGIKNSTSPSLSLQRRGTFMVSFV